MLKRESCGLCEKLAAFFVCIFLGERSPLDGRLAMGLKVGVGPRKVVVAKEASMGRQWRRVRRSEHQVACTVDKRALAYGIAAP